LQVSDQGKNKMKKENLSPLFVLMGGFITYWLFCAVVIAQTVARG